MDMKKLALGLVVCLAMVTTTLDAYAAKRIGGGMSFGRPAPTFTQKAPGATMSPNTAAPSAAPRQQQTPGATPASTPRPQSTAMSWLGRIGVALGLASLFSMLGLSGGTGMLLILLAVAALFLFMRGRAQSTQRVQTTPSAADVVMDKPREEPAPVQTPSQFSTTGAAPRKGSVMDEFMSGARSTATAPEEGVADITPEDFDKEAFLKVALENYRLLQKAWDTGNVTQISEFTTNDVFVAITHQLRARGNVTYTSEVKELSNELLGISQEGNIYLAAIKFTGKIAIDGDVEDIAEVWTLEKPVAGSQGWQLAGIKQLEGSTL